MTSDLQHDATTYNEQAVRQFWDIEAGAFDDAPDHGLKSPQVKKAWKQLLVKLLPSDSRKILDIGCGTGSLSVLMSQLGHSVDGIDLSPSMIELAKQKAKLQQEDIDFKVMNAEAIDYLPAAYDIIVSRHIVWNLSDGKAALRNWAELLKPGGRIVLFEGYWHTGGGLHADELLKLLPPTIQHSKVISLNNSDALWGQKVNDERYVITGERL